MIPMVRQFVAAINAGDVPGIGACMTEGHRFIDATGDVHSGRETMRSGWQQYLALFPDYRIVRISSPDAQRGNPALRAVTAGHHGLR